MADTGIDTEIAAYVVHQHQGLRRSDRGGVGEEVSGTIIDLVPTVLALLGMPVVLDMDGKVVEAAISPRFLEETPITYIDTYDTDFELDETEEDLSVSPELLARLRALGYVD